MLERQWLIEHLQTSMEDFIVAIQQVPSDRFETSPPRELGDWSAKRQIFHVTAYEQYIVLPGMKMWFGAEPVDMSNLPREEVIFKSNTQTIHELIEAFRAVRHEQIELCKTCSDEVWQKQIDTSWGKQSLCWVVSKTWQHTIEHMNSTLRIALFRDLLVAM